MRSILGQFIKNELDAYISDQRAYADPVVVSLIVKAFEAHDEYKRLVSLPKDQPMTRALIARCPECFTEVYTWTPETEAKAKSLGFKSMADYWANGQDV